jgi:hypothetical protein
MNTGTLEVLNVGEGDIKITFNGDDPMEAERARRIIGDMLARGYALFLHGKNDKLIRVHRFKPNTNTYLIADGPDLPAETEPLAARPEYAKDKPMREIKASKAKATVVGRSAGG